MKSAALGMMVLIGVISYSDEIKIREINLKKEAAIESLDIISRWEGGTLSCEIEGPVED